MSTILWRGDAPAVAQVSTITVTGTWATSDTATLTVNGKSVTFTVGATQTIAAVVAGLVAAWNASTIPELAEVTAANASPNITLTSDTAGVPFTVTTSEVTAGNGELSDPAATVANSGPADAAILANYSGAALPINDDTLVFENSANSALYNLEALTALTTLSVTVRQSFTGQIGLPKVHSTSLGSYIEYRPRYFKAGITALKIGEGEGAGSGRLMFNCGAAASAVSVFNSGAPAERGVPAILIIGTASTASVSVNKGVVGIACFAGETATAPTVNVGYTNSQAGDSTVYCGSGATLTNLLQSGGQVFLASNLASLAQDAGELTVDGTATVAAATIAGTVYDRSSGTWTTLELLATGVYDHRRSLTAKTITNAVTMADGAKFYDPFQVVTFSGGFICNPEKVVLDLGDVVLTGSGA